MSISNPSRPWPATSLPLAALWEKPRLCLLGGTLLVVGLTLWIYWPALSGGFVLDDDLLISSNKLVLASDGLYRMWFTRQPVDYWPLTNSVFWFEWRLWDLNTTGYHVVNVVLQMCNVMMIWQLLRRLSAPGAFLAALLFAVHPVNVESVAWISQLKNTLSLFFCLWSVWWYLQAEPSWTVRNEQAGTALRDVPAARLTYRWYGLSLLAFTAAMLSKGSAATLPLLLLLLLWWQRGRLRGSDVLRTAPFFIIAVVFTVVNIWFQMRGSEHAIRDVTPLARLLGASAGIWFYLGKSLLPVQLLFVYPQWQINPANALWWIPLVATLTVTTILWRWRQRRWIRPLWVAWLAFCFGLLPVLGFVDVSFMKYSLVADHYQYTALIFVMVLIAGAWSLAVQRTSSALRKVLLGMAILAVGGFSVLSRMQSELYADALILYRATLEKNPNSSLLQNDCGLLLLNNGQAEAAIQCFQSALNLEPESAESLNNLGNALASVNRLEEALANYRRALSLFPNFPQAHHNLGLLLFKQGQTDQAIAEYREAIRLNSFYPQAYYNLAKALLSQGQLQPALDNYQLALQYNPDYLEAHNDLAAALMKVGRPADAVEHYQQSLRSAPDVPETENNLASAFIQMEQPQAAIDHLQRALRLKPDYASAQHNLGLALANMGQFEQAIAHYERALQLKPDLPGAENNLGTALRQIGQLPQALEHYQIAIAQNHEYAQAYANEAVAFAQLNRPADAATAAQKAIELAKSQGKTKLVQQIQVWLDTQHATPTNSSHR